MKLPPYTLQEAKDLCAEHQFITGMPFDEGEIAAIDIVIVAPHDQNSKNRFLMLYMMLNDANEALTIDYSGNKYDVLVISGSATSAGMQHLSLSDWHSSGKKEYNSSFSTNATVEI